MGPLLDMRHLIMIRAIAESGRVTDAAEHLRLTPSALSHRTARPSVLFTRMHKRLRRTPATEHLAAVAERVLESYNAYHWLPGFLAYLRESTRDRPAGDGRRGQGCGSGLGQSPCRSGPGLRRDGKQRHSAHPPIRGRTAIRHVAGAPPRKEGLHRGAGHRRRDLHRFCQDAGAGPRELWLPSAGRAAVSREFAGHRGPGDHKITRTALSRCFKSKSSSQTIASAQDLL